LLERKEAMEMNHSSGKTDEQLVAVIGKRAGIGRPGFTKTFGEELHARKLERKGFLKYEGPSTWSVTLAGHAEFQIDKGLGLKSRSK
jgi:hypothetical protein